MITFYVDAFRSMGGWAWRARVWAHRHPRWARTIATVALIGYFTFIQGQTAHAVSFLPDGVDYIDSHGNPFSKYGVIDINAGDVWTPGTVVVNFIVQLLWSMQYFATGVILWLFDFLLSFEWVAWLATPFNTLAVWVQEQLGTVNWIPFALVISALVGGIALYVGRVSGGLWEMLVSAVLAVLAVGVLANPVATLTASGGVLDNAQEFGSQLANSIVVDPDAQSSDGTLATAVNATLMDIFVRIPYQVISYAQVLPDNCQGIFDTFIQSGEPQSALRDCAPEAARFAHDNPGGMNILNAMVAGGGVSVMFVFGMVIAALLMVSVVFFLVAAVKSMLLVYLCILPVNREPLWKAISDTYMGAISLAVMTVVMALYLKMTTWIMGQTGFLPHQLRMVLLIIFLIIVIVLVWRARRATLRAGRGVAGQLNKLGLGMKPGPKDSNALLKMSAIASMANTAKDLIKRRPAKPSAAALPEKPAAPEPEPVTLTQVRDPGTGPQGGAGGGRGPSGTHGPSVGPGAARKALGAASTATSVAKGAATVAKGAASGGVAGAAAAGAVVVGKSVAQKTANKATSAVTNAAARRVAPPVVDAGELKVVKVAETRASRIEVDAQGVATAHRKSVTGVQDISSLPPRPTQRPSARSLERRRQLEACRPRELTRG
ncbi:MAG: hypothetical protein DI630_28135 [Gordonia sp. (in: high G+C Gram-positive bacteria)]|nr:MAG: hypothetical protein DI630_28135 [Gordonia sp. (in: high G+C Gram-positive bacteria)]